MSMPTEQITEGSFTDDENVESHHEVFNFYNQGLFK